MATQKTYQIDDSQGSYPFVPSTEEHNRLEEQSAGLNKAMLDKPVCAPLNRPKRILDIGCGTGFQTDLLAQMYPNAEIIGLDKSPVPDLRPKRPNITYVLGDLEDFCGKHPLLQPNTFDLIYQRMLVMGITSWPTHLTLMKSLLKPGGYLESQEMNLWDIYDKNETLVSENLQCLDVSVRGPLTQGVDVQVGKKLPKLMREAGFEDVELRQFPMAFREGWEEKPETEVLARYLNWACRPMWRFLIEKGAREGEDAEGLYKEFESQILEGEVGLHAYFMVTVGRKG